MRPTGREESSTVTDPFKKAAEQSAPAQAQRDSHSNTASGVVTAGAVQDMANPFRKKSEVVSAGGGGVTWDPRVPFDYLEHRMVVMVPVSLNPESADPFNKGKTREEWRVNIIVLDGEQFEFTYNERAKNASGDFIKRADGSYEMKESTFAVTDFPATFREQSVAQGQLVKALKAVNEEGAFLYGVMRRVPVVADARAGATIESLAAKLEAWRQLIASGKPAGDRPRHTWNLDDRPEALTQERMDLAAAWWEQEKQRRVETAS